MTSIQKKRHDYKFIFIILLIAKPKLGDIYRISPRGDNITVYY